MWSFIPVSWIQEVYGEGDFNVNANKKERLASFFAAIREQGIVNGAFLAAEKGEVLLETAAGLADFRTGRPLTADTIFELASLSKPITALGIARLRQTGKVDFDDPVAKWIPELPYPGITIRHLLEHTSGLPDYMELLIEHWDRSVIATNQDVLNMLVKHQPDPEFPPNEGWSYSNTGYVMLAILMERISGKTFADYMKEQVFSPLGMNSTSVYNRRWEGRTIPNYAFGFVYNMEDSAYVLPDTVKETEYVIFLDGIQGDGTVNSNLRDLLRLDRALYSDDFLEGSLRDELFAPVRLNNGETFPYGLGWIVEEKEGLGKIVSHTGGWPGYATVMKRYLDQDMTLIVLQNAEKEMRYSQQVIDALEHILCDEDYEMPQPPVEREIVHVEPSVYEHYVGTYMLKSAADNGESMQVEVTVEDERLYIRLENGISLPLLPLNQARFFIQQATAEVEFIRGESGSFQHFIWHSEEETMQADRLRESPLAE
ncbi:Penicillin-binding protein 4* [Paenibacillus sp. CECT 9249]|nr:serine hydrolase [Paenibacillus sp. MSJ-34]CAH0122636.1 Penicillin-binding protein 4* [Paenibacillus sp. CECT 9249]